MPEYIKTFSVLTGFSLLFLGACTSVQVEYDRMTGTAFPQPQARDGDTHTLSTIYLQGNILLTVNEDDTNIAPLTGPANPADLNQYDYINPAEIDALELANRASSVGPESWSCSFWIFKGTCTRYHIYGIVVDHYKEKADGTRDTGGMGWMYDPALRSAFVNYYKNTTNSGDNAKYLRSTAHEIGHGHNLNHEDGDGSTTIMTTTGNINNSWTYQFSAASLDHLQNHDKDAVWPGIGPRHYTDHSQHVP